MGRHTIDLPCIVDTYIDRENPTSSFGSASVLLTGAFNQSYPQGQEMKYITLLKFDFSAVPTGKAITSTYLRVYSINDVKVNQYYDFKPLIIHPMEKSFTETDTYSSLNLDLPKFGGGDFEIDLATPKQSYLEIDILSYISNTNLKTNGLAILWVEDRRYIDYSNGAVWQIQGRNTTNPPTLRVTYEDTIPEKPTALDPIGLYVQNSDIVQFKWQYNNSTGESQNKFDLKWSTNGTTWTTVTQTTGNNYYNMPANTLPTGNIYWKVITYNEYNEASPESDISVFYAVGAPGTPIITEIANTNTPKPTIIWISESQQVYQVQVLQDGDTIYDTGSVPGISSREHIVTAFLDDGTYTVKVRIKNEFDLFSSWASANFTISTSKPMKPPITLQNCKHSINAISNLADNNYLLLFRKEVNSDSFRCIAKATTNIIEDCTIESNKQYQYFVRAVNGIGTYFDSDIKSVVSATFNMSVLSPVTELTNIFEVRHNLKERPVKTMNISTPNTSNYFSGRKYPVVEYSEHLGCAITLTFFINDVREYEKLLKIIYLKGIVLYRDKRRKFYGNISSINTMDHSAGYIVNLSINQTDYNEYLEV